MSDRRGFIKAGLMAALFTTASFKGIVGQSFKERDGNPGETPPVQSDPLANYSKAAFVSYLNSVFQIHTVAGVVEVTLARVDDMPAAKGGQCFSLLFRGGSNALKQDTYVLVHPSLATFQLFLVPGGADQNGAHEYLATINRLALTDAANMTPPSRSTPGARSSGSQSGSSNNNSTSIPNPNSTVAPSTQITAPTVTQTKVNPAVTTTTPGSGNSVRRRKRKPARKRIDSKAAVIN